MRSLDGPAPTLAFAGSIFDVCVVCVSIAAGLGGASCAPQPAAVTAPSGAPASPASAGSAPAPGSSSPAPAVSVPPPAPSTPSTPDEVVAAHRSGLDACYTKARAGDPKLGHTKVEMSYVIEADGTPKTVDFKYRHRMDDSAKNCMRDAALAVHFPASMAGPQTATIVFSPPTP